MNYEEFLAYKAKPENERTREDWKKHREYERYLDALNDKAIKEQWEADHGWKDHYDWDADDQGITYRSHYSQDW